MRYSPPPVSLGDRISSLYELQQDSETYNELERADRPQFRILLSGSGHYEFANGKIDPSGRVIILGPTSGPVRGIGTGPMHCVGAGLLPPAWVSIAGHDAEQWIDRAIDAQALFGECATALADAVAGAEDTDERFRLICAFLETATADTDPAKLAFTRKVDAWLCSAPDPQIDELVAHSGLSMRQLERLTKRYYGLPPKTLARKYRALRAASALARGEDLTDCDIANSFYDQSHLIREVKRFAGLTPQQIKKRQSQLLIEISVGRKSLEGQVGPLVSDA
jgi:AraC-like DNA-binding protein